MKNLPRFAKIAVCSCSYFPLLALGAGSMTPAGAASAFWVGTTADWFTATNWAPNGVPDATTTPTIGGASNNPTIANGNATSTNATIDNGGALDVSTGAVWTNVGSAPGFNLRGGAIVVGGVGQGTLLIENGGTVRTTGQTGSILIGNSLGSTGVVTVGNGVGTSSLVNAGPSGFPGNFFVGYGGSGTLNVNAGGSVSGFTGMTVGVDTGGVGNVTVNGGSLDTSFSSGALRVGGQGIGTVLVENGGQLTSYYSFIGEGTGSAGSSVTVEGPGSAWNVTGGILYLAEGAAGALTVRDSGVVNVNGSAVGARLDASNGSGAGTITIDDAQLNAQGASFFAGTSLGTANVTVENGGTLKTSSSYIGGGTFNSIGSGNVIVTGTGSLWDATLNASGVSVPSTIMLLANPTGGSAIDIRAGGKLVSGFTLIGSSGLPGTNTALTVDGSGSSWVSPYESIIGYEGSYAVGQTAASSGTVTVSGGATASSATMLVGRIRDSVSPGTADDRLTVTGVGSNLTVSPGNGFTGLLDVGFLGSGQMTVSNGATVNSTRGIIGYSSAAAGAWSTNAPAMNSFGDATVTGLGSSWTIGNALIVGDNVQGTTNGLLGTFAIGSGTSRGLLTIEDGAVVSDASAVVGANTGATGAVDVTGAGSLWTTTGNVQLGPGGSGSLSVDDGGAVSASDILLYSQGTLVLGTGSISSDIDGGAAGVGTFSTIDGTGLVSGDIGASAAIGLLAVAPPTGNSSLTIDGSLRATTTTISQNGTLTVGTGGAVGTIASAITDDGALIVNHSDNLILNGSIAGTGNFNLQGPGTFTINGASNPLTGLTTVEAGRLIVGDDTNPNASLSSAISVALGAALAGQGSVGTTAIRSGGVIAPGNSIGTLHINGGYSQAAGAIFDVEVDPSSSNSDRIAVNGAATLADGAVIHVIKTTNAPFLIGNRYTVLSTTGGLTGVFDPNLSSFSGLIASYDAYNAYLSVRSLAFLGRTRNQRATGDGLDSLPGTNPLNVAIQSLPSDDDIPAALDLLSGEIHASVQTALMEDSRFARDAATDRIRNAFCDGGKAAMVKGDNGPGDASPSGRSGGCGDDAATSWVRAIGSWARTEGDGNAARLDRSIGGFLAGVDVPVSDNWRVGGMAGYTRTNVDVDARRSDASSDDYHVGAYGGTQMGALGFRAGAIYTWHDISTRRSVEFGSFSDSPSSDYHADSTQVFGDLGYRIDAGPVALEPFGNLAYVNLHTDSFDEKGNEAALHGQGSTMNTGFSTLGVRASTSFGTAGLDLSASGSIGWRHAVGDVTPTSRHAFAGGDAFEVAGVPVARDAAVLDAGLDMRVSPAATLGLSYNGRFGSHANDQGVRGTLTIRF
ncbi:MAG: autotransporter domain-containing protein [Rhizobium sp.]